jgi:flagellar biosynthesis/type III secretory pathway protein FliH
LLSVVKASSVIEKEQLFVVELPPLVTEPAAEIDEDADELAFFRRADENAAEADDDDLKYYVSLEQKEQPEQARPSAGQTVETAPDSAVVVSSENIEPAAGEPRADSPAELAESAPPAQADPREQAAALIEAAREEAAKIIAEARKEEEDLLLKRAAEISEAEVKVEMAKNVAVNTVAEAEKQADQLLSGAREQARQLREEAKAAGYAEGVKTGQDAGYKEGLARGEEEGRRAGQETGQKAGRAAGEAAGRAAGEAAARAEMTEALAAATQRARDIVLEAEDEKTKIISAADDKIIKIALAVTSKILNKEIDGNPFIILQIVKEAAQKVADQPRLIITVSPANYELVKAARDDLKKSLGGKQEMTFVADSSLGPADVIVGTGGSGDVDARLETQLAEIRKTIETVMRQ